MPKDLFADFNTVSDDEWKAKIVKDLKGKDYDRTLLWTSPEGIVTAPFYTASSLQALLNRFGGDGIPPLKAATDRGWSILERIVVKEAAEANREALEALNGGAESIEFDLCGQTISRETFAKLTKDILMNIAPVSIVNGRIAHPEAVDKNAKGCFYDDSLLSALRSGGSDLFVDRGEGTSATGRQPISLSGHLFTEAGGDLVQEMAYTLALGNEYLHQLSPGPGTEIRVRLGTGGNFFFQIAKFRAFRRLWTAMTGQYPNGPYGLYLQAQGSAVNKSVLDRHTNLLRSTSEAMSAAIGGADAISNPPFDLNGKDSKDARRWSRNICLLLRHEAKIDAMADPAHQSFYIEALTAQLEEKAWSLFQTIEGDGGFVQFWRSGRLAKALAESRKEYTDAFAVRTATLVGVNDYPNTDELPEFPEETPSAGSDPLAAWRPAVLFESLRARTEQYIADGSDRPKAILIGTGAPAMRKARMNFASNALGCAGIATEECDLEAFLERSGEMKGKLYVLCSPDEEWEKAIPAIRARTEALFLLAGNPGGLSDATASSVDGALYRGGNLYAALRSILDKILV